MITDSLLQWQDRTGLTGFLHFHLAFGSIHQISIFSIMVRETTVNTIYKL